MKKITAALVAAALVGGLSLIGTAAPASATDTTPPVGECGYDSVLVKDAWTEVIADIEHPAIEEVSHTEYQRYSWTGGPLSEPPSEVPPSDHWQPNTSNYEGAGHGDDPVGEPFQQGKPGNADWFYWTATVVVDTPAVAAYTEVVPDIEHPAEYQQVPRECPVDPEPRACVALGGWYTEGDDVAPAQTPEGLAFTTTGEGTAVGYRAPVTGNLQGWGSVSYTATGDTSEFFFRLVVDLTEVNGDNYQSLSFPGYTTIDENSVSYQFPGKTIAQLADEWPEAVVTSIGFQTNSGAAAGKTAVLTGISGGCVNQSFVPVVIPEKPADVVTTDVSEDTDCEADEVVKTTTTTTVGTELVNNVWVPTEPVITTVTDTRAADDEECPPATTPPTATPTPTTPAPAAPAATPVTPAASSGLADTGYDTAPMLVTGAVVLLIGAAISALVAVAGRRKSLR
jgi:hypothetical protein